MKHLLGLLSSPKTFYTLAVIGVAFAEIVDLLAPQLNWLSISDNFLLLVLGFLLTGQLVKQGRPQSRKFFDVVDTWEPFNKYAENAREIFIAGGSLDGLTQRFDKFLVKKAKRGCRVRLILMDPTSPAIGPVQLWSDPDLPDNHPDFYREAICNSLKRLAAIDGAHRLEVRLNPSIPALAVIILDGDQPDGKIRVDIQPFQATVLERPVFELTRRNEDLQWYNLFYRQYAEELWSRAKPVDLNDLPPIC